MTGLRRSPVSTGLLCILAAVIVFLACIEVSRYARYSDLRYWAIRLERGQDVTQTAGWAALTAKASQLATAGECQGVFVKAAATIMLVNLDMQNPNSNYDAWSQAIRQADSFMRFALTCLPTDGNFWLRYAMIKQVIGEQPDELATLVNFSQSFAPAEENVLAARYSLYNRVSELSLERMSVPLAADIRVLCSASADRLRKKLSAPGARLKSQIDRVAPDCPQIGDAPKPR